jgi:uncharacterized protein (DUF433 family)
MQTKTIEIIDIGRGPQLSTSRITVLDLIPYFQDGCSVPEILRWLPTLSPEEIEVVRQHYLAHQDMFDKLDREATAYREEQIRLHQLRYPEPEGTLEERIERLRKLAADRIKERASEGTVS